MIKLPENKPKESDKTPRIFFIWGKSMSGKTYLARQFPNPILLNTDGNGKKVDTPSIPINNFLEFLEAIDLLKSSTHSFETIVIDLINDIDIMLTNYVCEDNKAKALADIPYGKGFGIFNSMWKNLMMKLSTLKMNIVFISHCTSKLENNNTILVPSLQDRTLNPCLGRCDISIQTKKLGNTYLKFTITKRDSYKPEDIKNPIIYNALKDVASLFEKPTPQVKTIQPTTNNKTIGGNK